MAIPLGHHNCPDYHDKATSTIPVRLTIVITRTNPKEQKQ